MPSPRWVSRRRIIRHHPQRVSELTHPEVFKAYDVRGLYGDELDPETAHAIGRSFARVIGAMEDKPTSELRLGLGRDMRLTAPEMAQAYRDGMVAEGATVRRCRHGRDRDALLPRRRAGPRRRADVHRIAQPQALHGRQAGQPRRAGPVGRRRAGRGARPDPRRAGRRARRRLGRGGRRLRGLPAGRAEARRPVGDQAAEGRRRRRQRHGGPDGRAPARAPRARSHRGLLDAGRQLPRPRAQPDAAREPRVHHARGRRAPGRPRHRLGRRRRPLLLHRRDRGTSSTATSSPRC